MAVLEPIRQATFDEAMSMIEIPPEATSGPRRFISLHKAFVPGKDLPGLEEFCGPGKPIVLIPKATFGGHVYSQSTLAACRVVRDQDDQGKRSEDRYSLHTIHGYFTLFGYPDRPFIYEVNPLATSATSKSFLTYMVNARQPLSESSFPSTSSSPSSTTSQLVPPPLGPICFTALVSFVPPSPYLSTPLPALGQLPAFVPVSASEPPPQVRFRDLLTSRDPSEWPLAPNVDIKGVTRHLGPVPGTFPGVELRKVEMDVAVGGLWDGLGHAKRADSREEAGKDVWERRELVLYRLYDGADGNDGVGGEADGNKHLALHAYVADRNGLLMLGNHLGIGEALGRVCSLSYSFVAHVDAKDAVMRRTSATSQPQGPVFGNGEWWIQEASFPRAAVGRGIVMNRMWSPEGVHVATGYQDGSIRGWAAEVAALRAKGKL